MTADIKRLGRHVLSRRQQLDLTQGEVADLGGPSDTKLGQIERGDGPTPSRKTLQRLDQVLGWKRGSARAALMDGAEPVVIADTPAVSDLPVDAWVLEFLADLSPEEQVALWASAMPVLDALKAKIMASRNGDGIKWAVDNPDGSGRNLSTEDPQPARP